MTCTPDPARLIPCDRCPLVSVNYKLPGDGEVCSSSFAPGHALQAALLDLELADAELLDLAGDGHGKLLDEAHVLRNLEVGNLPLAVGADLRLRGTAPRLQPNPGHHDLSQSIIGDSHHVHFGHLGMGIQKLLHFAR